MYRLGWNILLCNPTMGLKSSNNLKKGNYEMIKIHFSYYASIAAIIYTHSTFALTGYEVAKSIQDRYDSNLKTCSSGAPLYECSGVMVRGVSVPDNHEYDVWNPSPGSVERNGISFSFLRNDIARWLVGNDGGFIFFPSESKPAHSIEIMPLCYFPIDGVTFNRSGMGGCGSNPQYQESSPPCQEHGVLTASQWIQNSPNGIQQLDRQCGFDLYQYSPSEVASAFYEGILSSSLSDKPINNEIVVAAWPIDIPSQLPIEAFFYVEGRTDKVKIKFVQSDFYLHTGIVIPIIKLTEQKHGNNYDYTFSFDESDQSSIFKDVNASIK